MARHAAARPKYSCSNSATTADIYYARGNNLQAKQTLQSIIDNYDGEDLVGIAQSKYAAIVAAEQIVHPSEEEEITIELE